MPTYEYECKSCSYHFEAFQSIKDEPLKKCPQCGKSVRRLINGGSGIIFKGSGFYITDKGNSSVASKVKSSLAGGTSSDSTKTSHSPASESGNSEPEKKNQSDPGKSDVSKTTAPAQADSA